MEQYIESVTFEWSQGDLCDIRLHTESYETLQAYLPSHPHPAWPCTQSGPAWLPHLTVASWKCTNFSHHCPCFSYFGE